MMEEPRARFPLKCPSCGYEEKKCEATGCDNVATFEAWFRVLDPFTGKPNGLLQLLQVCSTCIEFSIAKEEKHDKDKNNPKHS